MAENPAENIPSLTCIECGKSVEPGKQFCLYCGAPQHTSDEQKTPRLLCFACGDEVPAEAVFCGSCGTRVWQERTTPTVVVPMRSAALPPSPPSATGESPQVVKSQAATQTNPLLVGAGAGLGVIVLVGLGLILGRIFFPPVPPPPPIIEEPDLGSRPEPPPPPPQPQGQVVTADGFFNIRVFGDGANDRGRLASTLKDRVESSLAGIRSVYAKELEADPHLIGILILEMTIASDGHVSRAISHATSITNPDFHRTVQDLAQDWRFDPTSAGEVNIFYPLLFAPAGVDPRALISFMSETLPGRYKIIASESVPVYTSPGSGTEQAGEVKPGLKVNIISSQGGWLGILSPKGKIGYVRQDAVSSKINSQGEGAVQ